MLHFRLIASPIIDQKSFDKLNAVLDDHLANGGDSVTAIVVKASPGFQRDIDAYIGSRLKQSHGQNRERLFLQHAQLSETLNPTSFIKNNFPDIASLLVVAVLGTLQLVTTFVRGEPERQWELNTDTLYHQFVFFYFLQFFTSALQLSGVALKGWLKGDPHPAVTLTGKDVSVSPTFQLSSRNIIGGFDSRKTTSNQFAEMPSLLTLANNGVLSIRPDQLERGAMESLTNVISSRPPLAFLGGATTHIIPLNMIIKFNEMLGVRESSELIYRNSGRIQTVLEIPNIHKVTPRNREILRQAISESVFKIQSQGYPPSLGNGVRDAIIDQLTLDRFGFDSAADYVVWTPEIRNIINRVTQSAVYLDSPIIEDQFIREFKLNITPMVIRQIQVEASRSLGVRLPSPGILKREYLHPGVENFTSDVNQNKFLNMNKEIWRNAVNNRRGTLNDWALFDHTPTIDLDEVRLMENEDPFIFIAGRGALVKALKSAADLRVQRAQWESYDQPEKPLIVVITDSAEGEKEQYSSGKTTLTHATAKYLNMKYEQLGIRRPRQMLSPENGVCRYTLHDPITSIARPNHYQYWPLYSVLLIQTVLFSMVNINISKRILDEVDTKQEEFAAVIFPWTLCVVNLVLSGALLYANWAVDKKLSDPDPIQLDTEKPGIIHLPANITKEELVGKTEFNPRSPQSQFRSRSLPRIWLAEMNFNTVLIENAHEMEGLAILKTLFEMSMSRSASLGETLQIPFTMRSLGIVANDPSGKIQEMASDYADVRAEVSVWLDYPMGCDSASVAERTTLEQLFLFHIRSAMTIPWDNASINRLLDKCINHKNQKIFYGIRYIANFIKEVERTVKRERFQRQNGSFRLPIEERIFEDAWKTFLEDHSHIRDYFL